MIKFTSIDNPATTENGYLPYPSLSSLRSAHQHLLMRRRDVGAVPAFFDEVLTFIRRGVAAGVLMDANEDRGVAQSLLDYWANELYRARKDAPEAILADFDPNQAPELDDGDCPYRGLDEFRETNQARFFGRERLVADLVERLIEHRFVVVLGPSGSGKSSLVLAGLLPALKAGLVPSFKAGTRPGSADWNYEFPPMFPGTDPLLNLARGLSNLSRLAGTETPDWVDRQVGGFRQDAGHLTSLLAASGERPVVVVVDQFEEVFTLCADDEARRAFVDNLVRLVQDPASQHRIVLTMRSDFEMKVAVFPALQAMFEQARMQVRMTPLSAGELRDAIEKPALAVNLKFEEGVVDDLVRDVLGEPAALPLLQFTLLKLWEKRERNRITREAYRDLGGGRQALANSAEAFYNDLITQEQITLRRILLKMVQPGEGLEFTRTRVLRRDLYRGAEAKERVDLVLDKLVAAHLVRQTNASADETQVEVAHEALVRNWPRLVKWLDEERAAIVRRGSLTLRAQAWQQKASDSDLLLRGSELEDVLRFDDQVVGGLVAEFISTSKDAAQAAEQAKETAREHELEQARALAEEQKRRAEVEGLRAEQETRTASSLRRLTTRLFVLVGAVAVLALIAGYNYFDARRNGDIAQTQAGLALSAKSTAVGQARIALSDKVAIEAGPLFPNQPDLASLLSLAAYQISPNGPARSSLETAYSNSQSAILQGHSDQVRGVAFSPDGKILASAGDDKTIRLWDVTTYQQIGAPLTNSTGTVNFVKFSPDGKTLASASSDGTIILWDVTTPTRPLPTAPLTGHTGAVNFVAFSLDGKTLASASSDRTIRFWDVTSHQPIGAPLVGYAGSVYGVAFNPDGKTLASLAKSPNGDEIWLWDVTTYKPIGAPLPVNTPPVPILLTPAPAIRVATPAPAVRVPTPAPAVHVATPTAVIRPPTQPAAPPPSVAVNMFAFSPNGKILALAKSDRTIRLWDFGANQPIGAPVTANTSAIYGIALSPDGKTLASASADQTIRFWDASTQQPTGLLVTGNIGQVLGLTFSGDGRILATASSDKKIRLWKVNAGPTPIFLAAPADPGHTARVNGLALSPDGKTLASASEDRTIRLWDVSTHKQIGSPLTGHTGPVNWVDFSPRGGKILASASEDGTIRLWDVTTRQPIGSPLTGHEDSVWHVRFSPDGSALASASYDRTIRLWDVSTHQQIGAPIGGYAGTVWSAAFGPNGKTVTSVGTGQDGQDEARSWDVSTHEQIGKPLPLGNRGPWAFSPDGITLAFAYSDGTIRLWDVTTGKQVGAIVPGRAGTFYSDVVFSLDGKTLASASSGLSIILWDVATLQPIGAPLTGHTSGPISPVVFSSDGKTLASASNDLTSSSTATTAWEIRLWDVTTRQQLGRAFTRHTATTVNSVAFNPDGKTFASASDDQMIRLWSVNTHAQIGASLTGHTGAVNAVAFNPDGKTLASASDDQTVRLWDLATAQPVGVPLTGHTGAVYAVAFSPDGKTLASASDDQTVRLWDLATAQPVGVPLTGHTGAVYAVAFSPDGKTLASASSDRTIRLWNVATHQPIDPPITGHTGAVYAVAFSPDGKSMASAGTDRTVRLWDIASHSLLGSPLSLHTGDVHSIAFSPDGKTLASASADKTIRLWDVASRLPIGVPLTGHTDTVETVAFGPDGKTFASAGADGIIRFWDAVPEAWSAQLCRVANRALTPDEWKLYVGDTEPYQPTCSPQS